MTNEMKDKIILITGATGGIGRVAAEQLAGMGGHVVIVGRNPRKTQTVVEEIRAATGNPQVDYLIGDLSLQADVKRVACEYTERYDRLHVLINNAGALFMRREVTSEGLEMTLALNHLAYFTLTYELLDLIKASAPARIINVASAAHYGSRIDFKRLDSGQPYVGYDAYGRSKLMNVVFTYELAHMLESSRVMVNCLHPGFVATNFGKNNGALYRPIMNLTHLFAISPQKGAETIVYLASSPAVEGITGRYFTNKTAVASSAASYDQNSWQRLWDASLELAQLNGHGPCEEVEGQPQAAQEAAAPIDA